MGPSLRSLQRAHLTADRGMRTRLGLVVNTNPKADIAGRNTQPPPVEIADCGTRRRPLNVLPSKFQHRTVRIRQCALMQNERSVRQMPS